ncbi:MAG: alanine racemase [Acidobacteriota bacterium]
MRPDTNRHSLLPLLADRRPTWIEVDLDALAANFRVVERACRNRPVWAVVKADAYGHGAVACSRALEEAGAAGLVVALPEEGVALRRVGITLPILLTGGLPSAGAALLLRERLTASISTVEDLDCLVSAAREADAPVDFHLELDTGMTRLGLSPDHLPDFLARLAQLPHLRLRAVMSHLASVRRPDDAAARRQLALFSRLVGEIRGLRGSGIQAHLASSPAICSFPAAFCDQVRVGLLLYGVSPDPRLSPSLPLRPVLSFRTRSILFRTVQAGCAVGYEGTWKPDTRTCIAIIGAGYADGLRREVSARADALVGGRRAPYVGAVNMDLAQLDLGKEGELPGHLTVTMVGTDGADAISIAELAERTGRTVYEWLTGFGARVPRIFLRGGRPTRIYTPLQGW